eukprot:264804-Prymnesium_polylepis.1
MITSTYAKFQARRPNLRDVGTRAHVPFRSIVNGRRTSCPPGPPRAGAVAIHSTRASTHCDTDFSTRWSSARS